MCPSSVWVYACVSCQMSGVKVNRVKQCAYLKVKNTGIRSMSLQNPKQTFEGLHGLKLTNHPEAPVSPAAQNAAPGNGCLNICDVMCVVVGTCACMRKRLHAIIRLHNYTQAHSVSIANSSSLFLYACWNMGAPTARCIPTEYKP